MGSISTIPRTKKNLL